MGYRLTHHHTTPAAIQNPATHPHMAIFRL